jgi:hypothetical protein
MQRQRLLQLSNLHRNTKARCKPLESLVAHATAGLPLAATNHTLMRHRCSSQAHSPELAASARQNIPAQARAATLSPSSAQLLKSIHPTKHHVMRHNIWLSNVYTAKEAQLQERSHPQPLSVSPAGTAPWRPPM